MSALPRREASVLIVGGGPAGLTAAATLAPLVTGEVLVIEREAQAGGIPRHSDHPGYGMRDLGRFLSGPRYAQRLRDRAVAAGAVILTSATVTDWIDDATLAVTTPGGRFAVSAGAIVLATGARERPRAARLVAGDRPRGVYTTGQLQNFVHVKHRAIGSRAVVVGSEAVSWSAVLTLRDARCRTVLMTTESERPEAYAAFTLGGRVLLRTPLARHTRVRRIIGRPTVEAVELEDLRTGALRTVACDTVVFTADWIPDNELARDAGLPLDPATRGPVVDTAFRTDRAGVFAIGNLVHPVDTADVAALDGRAVAGPVLDHLRGTGERGRSVALVAQAPLRWVSPARFSPDDPRPARGHLLLWSDAFAAFPLVTVTQDGRVLARRRLLWPAAPGRVFRVPATMLDAVSLDGGPVHIHLGA